MIYRSKIDAWLALLALAGLAAVIGLGLVPLLRQRAWAHAIAIVGVVALLIASVYPLHYQVTDSDLVVRSGIQRWQIPLAAIVGLKPTNSFVASPALSLERLEVSYEDNGKIRSLLISPKDQDGFLYELSTRVCRLRPFGFGLARAKGLKGVGARP